MASIQKRSDGRWRARFINPTTGKEVAKHCATKREAQKWIDDGTAGTVRGDYVDPKAGRATFREYAEAWRRAQVHREGTARSAETQLRLHVYPTLGDRPLRSVLPSEIQTLVRALAEHLAPATVRVIYGRVAAVFGAAVRDRMLTSTPCVSVKLPALPPSSTLEVLTTEDVLALAAAVPARYRALVVTGAGLGLRPGELLGLTVDRVDFLRRMVKVDRQLVRARGRPLALAPLKTQASYRTIPLPDAVGDEVAAHLSRWPAESTEMVFTNTRRAPIPYQSITEVWASARAAAELPEWATPHDLRHYYASLLIQSGASVKVVQSRLGHASATTTLDTYGHLFPEEEDRTRVAVDHALRPADFSRTAGHS